MRHINPRRGSTLMRIGVAGGILTTLLYYLLTRNDTCTVVDNESYSLLLFSLTSGGVAICLAIGVFLRLQNRNIIVRLLCGLLLAVLGVIFTWIALGLTHVRCMS